MICCLFGEKMKEKEKEKENCGRDLGNGVAELLGMSSIVSADGNDLSAHLQELQVSRRCRRHHLQITILCQNDHFLV